MVIIDQYTRRIIGFAVHAGSCDGIAYCRMFNRIASGKSLPAYLSSDNDPLFLFHRWKTNLRVVEIEELKSVPGCPTSHSFIERIIGSIRREFIDNIFFWNENDLENKLNNYKNYYNETRGHCAHLGNTPKQKSFPSKNRKNVATLENYKWENQCRGVFQIPIAA